MIMIKTCWVQFFSLPTHFKKSLYFFLGVTRILSILDFGLDGALRNFFPGDCPNGSLGSLGSVYYLKCRLVIISRKCCTIPIAI